MPYIQFVNEQEATGTVAEDYQYLSDSYSNLTGRQMATPQVYRTSSLIDSYFRFGALQNRVLTHDGQHSREEGPLPRILVNFGVAINSSCFY